MQKLVVSDDVMVSQFIVGLTTLLTSLKRSSHAYLFVGQIKRVISTLSPALVISDCHAPSTTSSSLSPSMETLRAYLTLVKYVDHNDHNVRLLIFSIEK